MTDLSSSLIWLTIQVTLFSLVGMAIYTIARRFGPRFGAMVTLACLLIITMLGLCALSPWPNWVPPSVAIQATEVQETSSSPSREPPNNLAPAASLPKEDLTSAIDSNPEEANPSEVTDGLMNDDATAHENSSDSSADAHSGFAPSDSPSESSSALRQVMASLWEELKKALAPPVETTVVESASWSWREILACVFLAGVGLGIRRTAGGLIAVRGHCRRSRELTDSDLKETVDVLRARLDCSRTVALRESAALPTAATVGWLRPIILLPRQWREWTPIQRQAVLAHELAHISRNDFCARVLSQFGVMLQFYHPLVHWLSGKLRLEQELAADATAAELVGGRSVYLTSLAELALKQPNIRLGWPAQTFLPTRGMFLRRIEMLRNTKVRVEGTKRGMLSKLLQGAALCALLVAGVAVAGLRGASEVKLAVESPGIDISDQDLESIAESAGKDTENNQFVEDSTDPIVSDKPILNDKKSLAHAAKRFNETTAKARRELFNPPIPDLTVERLREGFRESAKLYRRSGNVQVANAMVKIAETGRLPEESTGGMIGTGLNVPGKSGGTLTRRIVPGLVMADYSVEGGCSLVVLRTLELIYQKEGPSSKDYGDLFEDRSLTSNDYRNILGCWKVVSIEGTGGQFMTLSDSTKPGDQLVIPRVDSPNGRLWLSEKARRIGPPFASLHLHPNIAPSRLTYSAHANTENHFLDKNNPPDFGIYHLKGNKLTILAGHPDDILFKEGSEVVRPTYRDKSGKKTQGAPVASSWKIWLPAYPKEFTLDEGRKQILVKLRRVAAAVDPPNKPQGKFQFRLAQSKPGEGLVKVKNEIDGKAIYLHPEVIVDESHIVSARIVPDGNGRQSISFTLNKVGARRMRAATSKNLPDPKTGERKMLAIVVEGKVISSPTINSVITNSCQITGNFGEAKLKLLNPEEAPEETTVEQQDKAKVVTKHDNVKSLALGLLGYPVTHKCYPPPVLYGPEGKTPYSWRVAILPFIGEPYLYDQYKFDEPWDGPNNKKLLDKMPAAFRSPYDLPDSTFTSYFVLVGPKTVFPQQKGHDNSGMRIAPITDGTSNTLMVIESKYLSFELKDKEIEGREGLRVSGKFNVQIPWTKPTDIPYAADKPLQELGGWTKGKYAVAFCDGSTALLARDTEKDLLKALISRNGAEMVDRPPHPGLGFEFREFNDKTGKFDSRKAAAEIEIAPPGKEEQSPKSEPDLFDNLFPE